MKNISGTAAISYEGEKAFGVTTMNFNFNMENYHEGNPILGVVSQYVDFYSGDSEKDRKVNQLILDNTHYDKEGDLFITKVPVLKDAYGYRGLFKVGEFEKPLKSKSSEYWLRIEFKFYKKAFENEDILKTLSVR